MDFIEIFKVIIYGIVEGISEWMPISSTGHMILAEEILQFKASEEFFEMFRVVIQLGAIMAVVVLFFHKLNPISPSKTKEEKLETVSLWFKVAVACIPAAIIGILFDDRIDAMFYNYQTVAFTLILYGVLFIIIENRNKNRTPKIDSFQAMDYNTVLLIGVVITSSNSSHTSCGTIFRSPGDETSMYGKKIDPSFFFISCNS